MFPISRRPRSALLTMCAAAALCFPTTLCFGNDLAPQIALDLNGQVVDPLARDAKATVFIFARSDCPISNRYAPEVKRLYAQFNRKGVVFWLVYPETDASPDLIRKHVKDYGYPCAPLRDISHHLVQLARARVTPEAAVFAADGRLAYHGRIDDRYVAFGKWRPAPTRRDLEEAITAVLERKPVPASKPAIGCSISPKE